jgi:HEAT repeat protein
LRLLAHRKPQTRADAAALLGTIAATPAVIRGLQARLADGDQAVRLAAAASLHTFKQYAAARPTLLRALGREGTDQQLVAAHTLGVREPALAALRRLLKGGDARLQTAAARAVREHAENADLSSCAGALAEAAERGDGNVAGAAVGALAALGQRSPEAALAGLRRVFASGKRAVTVAAIVKLATTRALPELTRALRDAAPDVRVAALAALPALAATMLKLLPELTRALRDPVRAVRIAALAALRTLPAATTLKLLPELTRALGDSDPAVRNAALAAIEPLGAAASGCIPRLESMLAARDRASVEATLRVLGRMGPAHAARVVPLLEQMLRHREYSVRRTAVSCLVGYGAGAEATIARISRSGEVKLLLLTELSRSPAPRVSLGLLVGLLGDQEVAVRRLAVDVIGKLGAGARSTLPMLRQKADGDPDPGVRRRAKLAIQRVTATP